MYISFCLSRRFATLMLFTLLSYHFLLRSHHPISLQIIFTKPTKKHRKMYENPIHTCLRVFFSSLSFDPFRSNPFFWDTPGGVHTCILIISLFTLLPLLYIPPAGEAPLPSRSPPSLSTSLHHSFLAPYVGSYVQKFHVNRLRRVS